MFRATMLMLEVLLFEVVRHMLEVFLFVGVSIIVVVLGPVPGWAMIDHLVLRVVWADEQAHAVIVRVAVHTGAFVVHGFDELGVLDGSGTTCLGRLRWRGATIFPGLWVSRAELGSLVAPIRISELATRSRQPTTAPLEGLRTLKSTGPLLALPTCSAPGQLSKANSEQSTSLLACLLPSPAEHSSDIRNLNGKVHPSTRLTSTQSTPPALKLASNLVSTGGAQPMVSLQFCPGPPLSPISH